MELNLKDKVVVITGAGQGIGKAVADGFGQEGCKLAICDISKENLAAVTEEFEALGYPVFTGIVDVSDYDQMKKFGDDVVEHYGKVDVWINHAGIAENKGLLESDHSEWERVLKINLNSALYGIQIAGNLMKGHGGVILNTSSYSSLVPASRRTAYVASKAAINGVTRMAGGELAPYGIRVLAIAPGTIETPMQLIRSPEEKKAAVAKIALQRACKPEELAKVYVFLASDAACYMTSLVIEVSGGKLAIQDPDTPWKRAGKL
mgnify:CR=1 FL=1